MSKLGLTRGTVKLVPNDPRWLLEFNKERGNLENVFGEKILAIEHIGSTAILEIPAKPIIDINVGIESIDSISDFIEPLKKLGYEFMPERRFDDRQFFPKGPEELRTHHLNLVEIDSETAWLNPLLFRDYLNKNKTVRNEYRALKESLAMKFANDRMKYSEGKSEFIMKVLEVAKSDVTV